MLRADVAVIGGTGVGERLATLPGRFLIVPTRFGPLSGRLIEHAGKSVFAIQRHSRGHRTPPHLISFKAIAQGAKSLRVKACYSTAAVGSLHEKWPPGTFVVCTDLLDLTCRRLTLFDQTVQHTDMSQPFPLSPRIAAACQELGVSAQIGATYVGGDGPRYESPAEIRAMQTLGGDVVGMTASSEAILMREAGVPYGCLAVVTNLACGLSSQTLYHGEVTDVMQAHGDTALSILMKAAVT